MAYLAYKWYKNRKNKLPVESSEPDTSEPSYPTEPSKLYEPTKPTKASKPTKSEKKRDCIHRRGVSQISESAMELTAHPDGAPEVHEKTDLVDNSSPCAECKEAKRAARIYRWRIISGLFVPFLVQSLDVTIIAGALPFIASDFNQLAQLNWIVSAFNLTSACFIPSWGQLADVFGRYYAMQFSLIFMVIGSVLCAAAPVTSFPMLLVGRALQGIGCAGMLINTKVILADKVTLEENAKNNTIFTIVGGVGYGIGPVVGGYLTQVSWRWCFIINIPLGLIGMVLVHFVLRPELLGPQEIKRVDGVTDVNIEQTFKARLLTIDYGGQILFLFGLGLLVLALTWAGSSYAWNSVQILAPLIIGVALLAAFIVWEYLMLPGHFLSRRNPTRKAMLPFKLLVARNVSILMYISFLTGMAMYAVFYFVDLYFALVHGKDSGESGVNLLYYLPGLAAGSYMAMFACNVWPLQTFATLFLGVVLEPLGLTLIALALDKEGMPFIIGMLVLTGVGTGVRFMPGTLHGIGYYPRQIASIVSLMSLMVSLGGTIATTLMLNIFNNTLSQGGINFSSAGSSSFDAIAGLGPVEQEYIRGKAKRGIVLAFYALSSFGWLGLIFTLALGNVTIGKKGKADKVVKGSYLGSLFRGEKPSEVE
ncbi:hypothetical protein VE01_05293 [Pseudogymnoascus verrucosus]|uniref:Major facilitator superfamily (MFS) profile domain-containing protein n=1 Tax=Pseudogymnoascus verrucosus TaxID=342668 RepID=A0A1B8GLF1_9PEZI|nr:uncharacterized protein VE01_05293 [Pseudogymnoascus verrucosus]OBT96626.1 hypothetical protein VE01_05293 [Pseudogymnoascus verrucosus]